MRTTILLLLAFCLLVSSQLTGVAQTTQRMTPQLALARICASEASLQITDDCAAIHQVLDFRSNLRGFRYVTFARLYSTRVFDPNRTDRRAWLSHLSANGAEPLHWPLWRSQRQGDQGLVTLERVPHPTWERLRGRWLSLYQHAGRIMRGEVENQCEMEIHDWGGDMDTARYLRRNPHAVRVNCGDTVNTFWHLPHRATRTQ